MNKSTLNAAFLQDDYLEQEYIKMWKVCEAIYLVQTIYN